LCPVRYETRPHRNQSPRLFLDSTDDAALGASANCLHRNVEDVTIVNAGNGGIHVFLRVVGLSRSGGVRTIPQLASGVLILPQDAHVRSRCRFAVKARVRAGPWLEEVLARVPLGPGSRPRSFVADAKFQVWPLPPGVRRVERAVADVTAVGLTQLALY